MDKIAQDGTGQISYGLYQLNPYTAVITDSVKFLKFAKCFLSSNHVKEISKYSHFVNEETGYMSL